MGLSLHIKTFKKLEQYVLCTVHHFQLITCLVGKEKVFMGIAERFNFKIWTAGDKRKVLHCLENRQLLDRLTSDPLEAQVHVVAMREIALEVKSIKNLPDKIQTSTS